MFAFVRGADDGTAIVHLVNQNCRADADEAESYRNVTVDLNRPSRWEPLTEVTWHEPGAEPVRVEPERHGTVIRVTVPRLGAWGMLRLRRGTTLAVAGSSGSPIGSDAARDADHRTDAIGE